MYGSCTRNPLLFIVQILRLVLPSLLIVKTSPLPWAQKLRLQALINRKLGKLADAIFSCQGSACLTTHADALTKEAVMISTLKFKSL